MEFNKLKEKFKKIQESGKYNMVMDAKTIANILGLTTKEYFKFLETIE